MNVGRLFAKIQLIIIAYCFVAAFNSGQSKSKGCSLETHKFQVHSTANYSWSQNDELCLRILQFSCFRPLPMKESHRKAKKN